MKTALIYFSGTGVTQIIAQAVKAELDRREFSVDLVDITSLKARKDFNPHGYDKFIMGFPVYADFAPSVINEWLATLDGRGRECALFCTYGARTSGYFHYHTREILSQGGFKVLLSAEFLGRHTFNVAGWKILPDRPDESDLTLAAEYAKVVRGMFLNESVPELHLQKPVGYDAKLAQARSASAPQERKANQPFRKTRDCSLCRLCEKNCPSGAFDADGGLSEPSLCISCMGCLYHCPDKVIVLGDAMYSSYEGFVKSWGLTDEVMARKKSKLVLKAWDTVQ